MAFCNGRVPDVITGVQGFPDRHFQLALPKVFQFNRKSGKILGSTRLWFSELGALQVYNYCPRARHSTPRAAARRDRADGCMRARAV